VCGIKSREAPFGQLVEKADLTAEQIKELKCNEDPPCGLVIIGTERHEARRIDRQLRGRSGRQGDPGQSIFYLSLEDDLMRLFGSDRIARIMDRTGAEEGEVITHPWVTAAIGQAQKRVELQNFQARKRLLQFDDVMNQQREVIYSQRLYALEGGEELKAEAQRMIDSAVERLAEALIAEYDDPGQWDRALIETEFLQKFLTSIPGVTDPHKVRTREDLVRAAQQAGREAFQKKLDYLRDVETKTGIPKLAEQALAQITIGVVDDKWRDHLYDLDQLREGIYYRAWGQKDPLVEYKQEAFEMFTGLIHDLRTTFAERWLKLQIEVGPPPGAAGQRPPSRPVTGPAGGLPGGSRRQTPIVASKAAADGLVTSGEPPPPSVQRSVAGGVAEPAFAVNPYAGVGRNDPCPCGSGKKFKKCHGAAL